MINTERMVSSEDVPGTAGRFCRREATRKTLSRNNKVRSQCMAGPGIFKSLQLVDRSEWDAKVNSPQLRARGGEGGASFGGMYLYVVVCPP